MPESKSVGFVILPDEETTKKARELYNSVAGRFDTIYDLESHQPHITLYQAKFNSEGIEQVKETFTEIIMGVRISPIKLGDISAFSNTYLFWDCEPKKNLQDLHEKVVKRLSSFRDTSEAPASKQGLNIPAVMKRNMQLYGYPLAMGQYRPHITITRLERKEDAKAALITLNEQRRQIGNVSFQPSGFAVYYLGPNGEAVKEIDWIGVA